MKEYIEFEDVTENSVGTFTTFASDLQWGPGQWPMMVETCVGNGQPFMLENVNENCARYRQNHPTGDDVFLTVYND